MRGSFSAQYTSSRSPPLTPPTRLKCSHTSPAVRPMPSSDCSPELASDNPIRPRLDRTQATSRLSCCRRTAGAARWVRIGTRPSSASRWKPARAAACVRTRKSRSLSSGLQHQGNDHRARGDARGPGHAGRVEQRDAQQREDQVTQGLHDLQAQRGHRARRDDGVAALGHVGHRSALEVAVAQSRQLVEQGEAQPGIQVATQPQRLSHDGQLDREQQAAGRQ